MRSNKKCANNVWCFKIRLHDRNKINVYSPVPNNMGGGVLIKVCVCVCVCVCVWGGGGPTDNLIPINGEVQKKGGRGLKNVLDQKCQSVITNYGCPKQLLIVEKYQ